MKNTLNRYSIFIVLIFNLFTAPAGYAQKLPGVQPGSLPAPAQIKIDGKSTEWGQFQAYNKSTDVYYSLANDADNIYLVVQATDRDIIYKIMNGGITFTINTSGKKNDQSGVVITYPLFSRNNPPFIKVDQGQLFGFDTAARNKQIALMMSRSNTQITNKSKEIKLSGIKAINDSLISVYNQDGIKTGQRFDNKLAYTYELALPLKYLDFKANNDRSFAYNIKLYGLELIAPQSKSTAIVVVKDILLSTIAPTDFWGEYTLKK